MTMVADPDGRRRVLEPIERLSEILFGLIMVLTFTGSLSIATAEHADVREMLVGALGCNFAWGLIDAIMYLMAAMAERARDHHTVTAVHGASTKQMAHEAIRAYLPPMVGSALGDAEVENIRAAVLDLKHLPPRPRLHAQDWRGALGVFVLVFLSTFPVVIPFVVMTEIGPAMRVSNAIAVTMLAIIGYAYGRLAGYWPLVTAGAMVVLGSILVAATIALGG
jgi:VIT1/CCC1 family predicted Fe2+/Mn2+ transporter